MLKLKISWEAIHLYCYRVFVLALQGVISSVTLHWVTSSDWLNSEEVIGKYVEVDVAC
jgi:hypothetical protein